MSTNNRRTSAEIIAQIRKWQAVRVSTGNIQRHSELFRRMFKNSAEELVAALLVQLDGTNGPELELKSDGTVVLVRDAENCLLSSVDRADMKITLKIVLSSLDIKSVEECVDLVLRDLNIKSVSQLIITFPSDDDKLDIDRSVPAEVQRWLSEILPFWRQLETLVSNHKVHTLGVADLDFEQLRALHEAAECHPPMIDHYNIENCCTVPHELREYAKEKDIQLLTHNDPPLSSISERLGSVTKKLFGDEKFEVEWSARVTVWLRSRSIIGGKGYILQFRRSM